jgi:hypothetical protein
VLLNSLPLMAALAASLLLGASDASAQNISPSSTGTYNWQTTDPNTG